MKNLYKFIAATLVILSISSEVFSQNYITWINTGGVITGTDGAGITVNLSLSAGANQFIFNLPANQQANLVVTGANTFSTRGPNNNPPSRNLIFTFNRPVIVTRYNMADIDLGSQWNDSFNFTNINYANSTSTNCNANTTGVIATTDLGASAEFASWFCSNPVTTFSLNYFGNNNNLTHAYLGYSMEVIAVPLLDAICMNDPPPPFPTIGNGIIGNWLPTTIDTSIAGTSSYTFTPNAGQALQCPINMDVTIVDDCCLPNLTSSMPINSMVQEERDFWISSSDVITFSDGIIGNGVVYHAGNFVELTEGFDAVTGSQFTAYPQGCSGNYQYRQPNENSEINLKGFSETYIVNENHNVFDIVVDKSGGFIEIPEINLDIDKITIYSLSGQILYVGGLEDKISTRVSINAFDTGVYIAVLSTKSGYTFSQKFIKK
ncbi:putative secreted protein (Por secretion system target) [Winogradskyella eximia]|uniref:Putative secreted protein (Por secretion system target) n=1 Tax=Winogradskyella eximia TaxID=262006 RepID=A0A3D9GYX6_9FLAO|nr:T9SS type A sorting domain-containing protein [Winogradskyella eximia]RED42165.1 putative secreted protein (Por secretion system target) [Winogradskyella eximia]